MSTTSEPATIDRAPRDHRGKRRKLLWATAIFAVLGASVLLILSRPSVFTSLFASGLGERLGAEVQIESGAWKGGSRFAFKGVTIRAAGMEGPPGEIASIDSLETEINFAGLFGSGPVLESVVVGPATLRVAEHVSDVKDLNIGRLFTDRGGSDSIPALPKKITLESLTLERGRYDGASWFYQGEVELKGEAQPNPGRLGAYEFSLDGRTSALEELEAADTSAVVLDAAGDDEFSIRGTFDPNARVLNASLSKGQLDERVITLLPLSMREWTSRLDLKGAVQEIAIEWEFGQTPRVEVDLHDVELTVPSQLGLGDFWSRYSDQEHVPSPDLPRMLVHSGKIMLQGEVLKFKGLQGHFTSDTEELLAEIPFTLEMSISGLQPGGLGEDDRWVERLARAPFSIEMRTDNFTLGQGPGQAQQADLPRIVAQILSMFRVISCTVNTQIKVHRGTAVGDDPAPIRYEGQLGITDAAGAYEGFPYPLEHLGAHVEFDTETVRVKSLNAQGSGGSSIRITGEVVPLMEGSNVDMELMASGLPLDMRLLEAMPPESALTLRSLFQDHGVDAPAGDQLDGSSHEVVDLNLDILRASGPDQPTRLQGTIDFDHMDLTWDSFPYPITLDAGRLRWIGDELRLENSNGGPSLEFVTVAGATGAVEGVIRLPMDDQAASGRLDFDIRQQPITESFIEALSHVAPDMADLLVALNLSGNLLITGPVEVDGRGNVTWDLAIELIDGAGVPRDRFVKFLGVEKAFWKRGMQLEHVGAKIKTTQDYIGIASLAAEGEGMALAMNGIVHLHDPLRTEVHVRADDVPVQERLLRLASGTLRETLASLWHRWQPSGSVGLDATVHGTGDQGRTVIAIDELDLELTISDSAEQLQVAGGEIILDASSIVIENLEVDASTSGIADGRYSLHGEVQWDELGTETELSCSLDEGRFESPFLADMLAFFVEGEVASTWASLDPEGRFNGQAMLELDRGAQWQWRLDVQPKQAAATWNDARIEASFERGSLIAEDGRLSFDNLAGEAPCGSFQVLGELGTSDGLAGSLVFDFDGAIRSPEVMAILPAEAASVIESIEFKDGRGTSIRAGRLELKSDSDQDVLILDTELVFEGASLQVGPVFENAQGRAKMYLDSTTDAPLQFMFEGEFNTLVAAEQPMDHVQLSMRLKDDDTLALEEFSADFAGGELFAQAEFDLGQEQSWSVQVQVADAALSDFMPSTSADEQLEPVDGRLYASANLEGFIGRVDRIGEGRIRIYGGVQPLPVTVGIYQILQLSNPFVDSPEFFDVTWYLDDEAITLDSIRLESQAAGVVTFSMNGEGTFDWETKSISAILRPRSGWAVISDVLGVLQDRFYAVSVEGPIADPDVKITPFPDLQ